MSEKNLIPRLVLIFLALILVLPPVTALKVQMKTEEKSFQPSDEIKTNLILPGVPVTYNRGAPPAGFRVLHRIGFRSNDDPGNDDPLTGTWITSSTKEFKNQSVDGTQSGNTQVDIDCYRVNLTRTANYKQWLKITIKIKNNRSLMARVIFPGAVLSYLLDFDEAGGVWGNTSYLNFSAHYNGTHYIIINGLNSSETKYDLLNITFGNSTASDDNDYYTSADSITSTTLPTMATLNQAQDNVDWYDFTPIIQSTGLDSGRGDEILITFSVDIARESRGHCILSDGSIGRSFTWTQVFYLLYDYTRNQWIYYVDAQGHPYLQGGSPYVSNTEPIPIQIRGKFSHILVSVFTFSVYESNNRMYLAEPNARISYNFTSLQAHNIIPNDPPVFHGPLPDKTIHEDNPGEGFQIWDLKSYFTDKESSNLRYSIEYKETGISDKVKIALDPDGHHLNVTYLSPNWYGVVPLEAKAFDVGSDQIPGTSDDLSNKSNVFHLIVQPTNDPPKITKIGDILNQHIPIYLTATEDRTITVTLWAVDIDNDPDHPMRFSTNRSDGVGMDDLINFYIDDKTGRIEFTPVNEEVGEIWVNLTVTDNNGTNSMDWAIIVFDVINTNDPPRLLKIGGRNVIGNEMLTFDATEDEELNLTLVADDPDIDVGADDVLLFSTNDSRINVIPDTNNLEKAYLLFTPTNDDVGDVYVTVMVKDRMGIDWDDTFPIRIRVENTNDPPRIIYVNQIPVNETKQVILTGERGAKEDELFTITIVAQDVDLGDKLTFSIDSPYFTEETTHSAMMMNFTFTPVQAMVGNLTAKVTVMDKARAKDSVIIFLQILNVNDPPEKPNLILLTPGPTYYTGDVVDFKAEPGRDPDGDVQVMRWDFGDGNSAEGIRVNHTYNRAGTFTVTLTADDGHGGTAKDTVDVIVIKKPQSGPVDADHDNIPDTWEINHGLSPSDPNDGYADYDKDGLTNYQEYLNGTDPLRPDTDGDGFKDGEEIKDGTDPLNASSHPIRKVNRGPLYTIILLVIVAVIVTAAVLYVIYKKGPATKERPVVGYPPEAPVGYPPETKMVQQPPQEVVTPFMREKGLTKEMESKTPLTGEEKDIWRPPQQSEEELFNPEGEEDIKEAEELSEEEEGFNVYCDIPPAQK